MFLAALGLWMASVKGHGEAKTQQDGPTQQAGRSSFDKPALRGTTPQNALDQFVEVSKQAGVDFTLTSGGLEKRYIIEAKGGGGVAWIDYNNDGFPDLFFVNGSTFEHWKRGDSPRFVLYRNNGDGTFTDVSAGSGLDKTGWGMGVCVETTTTMASTTCT